MWALVINPTSGSGKGSVVGRKVRDFLVERGLEHEIIEGDSASNVRKNLSIFLAKYPDCPGVVTVGGDGSAHEAMQVTTPLGVPLAIIPAGTGNDLVRALGWSLDDLRDYLEKIVSTPYASIDLGQVGSEWFGAVLSTGFDSIVNERANSLRLSYHVFERAIMKLPWMSKSSQHGRCLLLLQMGVATAGEC